MKKNPQKKYKTNTFWEIAIYDIFIMIFILMITISYTKRNKGEKNETNNKRETKKV